MFIYPWKIAPPLSYKTPLNGIYQNISSSYRPTPPKFHSYLTPRKLQESQQQNYTHVQNSWILLFYFKLTTANVDSLTHLSYLLILLLMMIMMMMIMMMMMMMMATVTMDQYFSQGPIHIHSKIKKEIIIYITIRVRLCLDC